MSSTGHMKMAIGAGVAVLLGCVIVAVAGPLNPPTGPISATGRTHINAQFITSFPVVIDQPGSYVVTSNLTNNTVNQGIIITSDNVFLDLNGFTLSGEGVSSANFRHGIEVAPGLVNVHVMNGVLTGWKGASSSGLRASGEVVAERLMLTDNSEGLRVESQAVIRNCIAADNDTGGFINIDTGIFIQCAAFGNPQSGFLSTLAARFIDCHTTSNGIGFRLAGGDAAISRCTSNGDGVGFQQDGGSMFRGLLASDNLTF